MNPAPMLVDFTAEQFQALPDGTHHFRLQGPDGEIAPVRLYLWDARRKVRSAQFDLWPTPWNIKQGDLVAFNDIYRKYWKQHDTQIPKGGVSVPSGESTFTLDALKHDIGEWLHRAAQFICDTGHLYAIPTLLGNSNS